jgi:hypothetical protein
MRNPTQPRVAVLPNPASGSDSHAFRRVHTCKKPSGSVDILRTLVLVAVARVFRRGVILNMTREKTLASEEASYTKSKIQLAAEEQC